MISNVNNVDFDKMDNTAKRTVVELYMSNQTHESIYRDPEFFNPAQKFLLENQKLYYLLYRFDAKQYHLFVYILLTSHFGLDREEVEEAIVNGSISDLVFDTVCETDYAKTILGV